jgi:hypothetical protein
VRDHFGIGLRRKDITLRLEVLAQSLVVLDDPVVHDGDFAAGHVRMRVDRCRGTMRCPAGVRDPSASAEMSCLGLHGEIRDARGAHQTLEARYGTVPDERETGGVVAAIFEPADAVDQERDHVLRGGRADDAAHGDGSFRISRDIS